MNVEELLNSMAVLSGGQDTPSDADMPIWLGYLNFAHVDLFKKTAYQNPYALIVQETLTIDDTGLSDPLAKEPFRFLSVFDTILNKTLQEGSLDRLIAFDPLLSATQDPYCFINQYPKLRIYPKTSHPIHVVYRAGPTPFIQETPEADIPYPSFFHHILVDGALYYLYQDESGFKDSLKLQSALRKWQNGIIQLQQYLATLGGQKIYSTYRVV